MQYQCFCLLIESVLEITVLSQTNVVLKSVIVLLPLCHLIGISFLWLIVLYSMVGKNVTIVSLFTLKLTFCEISLACHVWRIFTNMFETSLIWKFVIFAVFTYHLFYQLVVFARPVFNHDFFVQTYPLLFSWIQWVVVVYIDIRLINSVVFCFKVMSDDVINYLELMRSKIVSLVKSDNYMTCWLPTDFDKFKSALQVFVFADAVLSTVLICVLMGHKFSLSFCPFATERTSSTNCSSIKSLDQDRGDSHKIESVLYIVIE